jgi:hypothetical protein
MRTKRTKRLFSIHESTRRGLCRAGLVCLVFLPCAVVFFGSLVMLSPWYQHVQRAQWEARISDTLGVRVTAGSFRMTAPQQFRATAVEVRHPETQALLARVARVDGLMKPHGWSILLDEPVLDAAQVDDGIQVLHDWFLCRPQTSSNLLAIGIPHGLKIHSSSGTTVIDRIEVLMRPSETATKIQSKIAMVDQPFGDVSIAVTRDHDAHAPATSVEVSSPKAWLSCAPWAARFPMLNNLGREARFRGVLHCNVQAVQWDASFTGEVEQIDWGAVTAAMGSPVHSAGSLRIDQLNVQDGKILRAQGGMELRGGSVHRAWLERLVQNLKLPGQWPTQGAEKKPELLDIENAGFDFALDGQGLRLQGKLRGPSHWPPVAAKMLGVILCTQDESLSLSALVHSLQSIPSPAGVPADVDLNAVYLTSILPWPSSVAPGPMAHPQARLSQRTDEVSLRQ